MIRFLTAGESHGSALITIIEGLPAGLPLLAEEIDRDLARRQVGFGRGGRMSIEHDRVQLIAGVRHGLTLGSPIALQVQNRDWPNWQEKMSPAPGFQAEAITRVRPGHADLAGALKYGHRDVRNVLERASARETASRVAAGAVARALLGRVGVTVRSHTLAIGGVQSHEQPHTAADWERVEASAVRTLDAGAEQEMIAAIKKASKGGDTLGGVFEVVAAGLPIGLGSHVQWDRRLDGQLAQALMSIPSVKGVEVGLGFAAAGLPGSQVHDQFAAPAERERPWARQSNNAGGIEGGISNGEPVVVRAACKPIPTLAHPLPSLDLLTGEEVQAHYERSDVCVVPAAGVVGEAMVCLVLASALVDKFGGDSMTELLRAVEAHKRETVPGTASDDEGDG